MTELRNRHNSSINTNNDSNSWLLWQSDCFTQNNNLPSPKINKSQQNISNDNNMENISNSQMTQKSIFSFEDLCNFCSNLLASFTHVLKSTFSSNNNNNIRITPIPLPISNLMHQFHTFATISYDSSNELHENTLQKYWNICNPTIELESRKSKQWKDLGFQGIDPATDFRGAGIFGLRCLYYFAGKYPNTFNFMLKGEDNKEKYPFSIAGLNIIMGIFELLGWGFKQEPQDEIVKRRLIRFLFENDFPINENISNNDNNDDFDLYEEISKLREYKEEKQEEERDIEFNINDLLYFEDSFDCEFGFYELFCYNFYQLHKLWYLKPNVQYMDFPIILKQTKDHMITIFKSKNQIPNDIISFNVSTNIKHIQ